MDGQRLVLASAGRSTDDDHNDDPGVLLGHGWLPPWWGSDEGGATLWEAAFASWGITAQNCCRAVKLPLVKWGFADATGRLEYRRGVLVGRAADDGFEDVSIHWGGHFSRMDRAIQDLAGASNQHSTMRELWVSAGEPPMDYDRWDDDMLDDVRSSRLIPRLFRELVNAIERNRHIEKLFVNMGDFRLEGVQLRRVHMSLQPYNPSLDSTAHEPGDADVERFFGTVLVNHPSLKNITFTDNFIHPRYVRLLADSIASRGTSLSILKFDYVPLTSGGCRAIQRMLEGGARVEKLAVTDCWVNQDEWRGICKAAAKSKYLKELLLVQDGLHVQPDIFLPVVDKKSTLKYLGVKADFTQAAVEAIFKALKTNTALERIKLVLASTEDGCRLTRVGLRAVDCLPVVDDVLNKYNLSLETVKLFDNHGEGTILGRSNGIHQQLQSRQYCVNQLSVWPSALHAFSEYPTVIFRFLRRGNMGAFAEHMLPTIGTHPSKKKKKRCREAAAEGHPRNVATFKRRLEETPTLAIDGLQSLMSFSARGLHTTEADI